MADRDRDALDRYWERLAAGRTDPRTDLRTDGTSDLDPTLADAVRRLHAADDVEGPSHAFVTRLQEELMLPNATAVPPPVDLDFPLLPNGRPRSTGGLPSFVPAVGSDRDRGWLPRLLAAAMILLTLGLAAWLVAPDDDGPGRLGGIPAVVLVDGEPVPSGVTDVGRLVEVALPEGIVAAGDRTDLALMLHTLPSGTLRREGADATGCCPGLNVIHVLAGTATVRADGPMLLHPAGFTLEPTPITAGTDAVLGPGDTLLYREEVAWDWTVSERGPMTILQSVAYAGFYGTHLSVFGSHPDDSRLVGALTFSTSTYPIRLWRATLAPGATLQPASGVVQLAVAPPDDDPRLADAAGHGVRNLGRDPVDLYVMSVGTPTADPTSSGRDETEPTVGDAEDSTPSPAGVTGEETLVEFTLPPVADSLGATTEVGLTIETAPAGSTTVWDDNLRSDCTGPTVSYVLEGTSTFRSGGPTSVLRAGGGATPDVIAAGTQLSLAPGDAMLYCDDFGWELTVTGDGPMRQLAFWMTEGPTLPSTDLASWVREDGEIVQADTVPAEPLTLRLGQVTIDAGATLSPGTAVVQVAVALPTEDARLATRDYAVKNAGRAPVNLYVASLSPADPNATPMILELDASPVAASPIVAKPEP